MVAETGSFEPLRQLNPEDQLILVKALTYWSYDMGGVDEDFDRSDPRRNRGIQIADELLSEGDILEEEISEVFHEICKAGLRRLQADRYLQLL